MADLMTKEESYLHHIFLAARVQDRGAPFRTFFDNWSAYAKGEHFLTKKGRGVPHWFNRPSVTKHYGALLRMDFMSADAKKIVDMLGVGGELAVDHAVPVAIIRDKLFEEVSGWSDPLQVRPFLQRWYRKGVITQEEHKLLRERGLNHAMPADWDGEDVFARYKKAGILPCAPLDIKE